MSLKENLLRKKEIEKLARQVLASLKPTDFGVKLNRRAMRKMLTWAGYERRDRRDLELWIRPQAEPAQKRYIIVLDGELKCYHTTIDDVVLRKSPTVKEMISIRNAIKILNDKDVVVTKAAGTLQAVKEELLAGLNLEVTPEGVAEIVAEGRQALENRYPEGVTEALELLADLLGWSPAPKGLTPPHTRIRGRSDGAERFGPLVLYAPARSYLCLLENTLATGDPGTAELLGDLAAGKERTAIEGPAVWDKLESMVLEAART